jgi:hypothetical protein
MLLTGTYAGDKPRTDRLHRMQILRRTLGNRYAFVVAAATFLALLSAAGLRAAPGVLILPLEKAFHWDRGLDLAGGRGSASSSTA